LIAATALSLALEDDSSVFTTLSCSSALLTKVFVVLGRLCTHISFVRLFIL
jgi:hypothetical protein